MAVVALIPTGRLEHIALAQSLQVLFPDDSFIVLPPERHRDGFTSCDVATLAAPEAKPVPTNLDELAAELVNAVFPGRRGRRVDFAFVVEDLELCNQHQPELVLRLFRNTVKSYIEQTWPQQAEPKLEKVREQCSFHLFCPMTEAYFFGEAAALERALATLEPQLPLDIDLEEFCTVDGVYLGFPAGHARIPDMPYRERHPKAYLDYLCDPTLADPKKRYRETRNGQAALRSLDWEQVLELPAHCPFAHAFLDDLCVALDRPLRFVNSDRVDPRVRFPGPMDRVLRNV